MPLPTGIRSLFRLLSPLTGLLLSCVAYAQEQEGDRVYRFTVQGITERESAKPVQYAMIDQGFVHMCEFIAECGCFKMAVPAPLTYAELENLLITSGFVLTGPVHVSDGSVLIPSSSTEPTK